MSQASSTNSPVRAYQSGPFSSCRRRLPWAGVPARVQAARQLLRLRSSSRERLRAQEDGVEHRLGQPAGEGVLLADVVAAEHASRPLGSCHLGAVRRTPAAARGTACPAPRRAGHSAVQPKPPSTTTARAVGSRKRSSAASHGAQASRSAGVGLLAGGAQRTGQRDAQCRRSSTAVVRRDARSGWLARPTRCSDGEQPVAAAVAGEDPAGAVAAVRGRARGRRRRSAAVCGPQPVIGRPQYSWSANDARLASATSSRQATSRGQARQTDDRPSRCVERRRAAGQPDDVGGASARPGVVRRRRGRVGRPVPGAITPAAAMLQAMPSRMSASLTSDLGQAEPVDEGGAAPARRRR